MWYIPTAYERKEEDTEKQKDRAREEYLLRLMGPKLLAKMREIHRDSWSRPAYTFFDGMASYVALQRIIRGYERAQRGRIKSNFLNGLRVSGLPN